MTPEDIEEMRVDLATATPGPWMAGHFSDDNSLCNCRSIVGEHGGMGAIALVQVDNGLKISDGGNDAPDIGQAKANNRLIARAPDMAAHIIAQQEEIERLRADVEKNKLAVSMVNPALAKSMAHFATVEEWKGYKQGVTDAVNLLRSNQET